MKPDPNYPRMMFHRSKDPVTVYSREEEDALGKEWSRVIWPADSVAAAVEPETPVLDPDTDPEYEPEEEDPPAKPRHPADFPPEEPEPTRRQPIYHPVKKTPSKSTKKKR